jgi:hypothetical protein
MIRTPRMPPVMKHEARALRITTPNTTPTREATALRAGRRKPEREY